MKDAYDAMKTARRRNALAAVVKEMEPEAEALGLKLRMRRMRWLTSSFFCEQYNEQTDDGPICNTS